MYLGDVETDRQLLEQTTAELLRLKETYTTLTAALARRETETSKLKDKMDMQNNRIQELEESGRVNVQKLQEQQVTFKAKQEANAMEYQASLTKLQRQNAELQDALDKLTDTSHTLASENVALKETVVLLEDELASVKVAALKQQTLMSTLNTLVSSTQNDT